MNFRALATLLRMLFAVLARPFFAFGWHIVCRIFLHDLLRRRSLLEAMATDKPAAGEEPDENSLNGKHVHLINYACEELWTLADDSICHLVFMTRCKQKHEGLSGPFCMKNRSLLTPRHRWMWNRCESILDGLSCKRWWRTASRESCKMNKMGGKLRRLNRSEKVEQENAAEMPLNDALQTLSQKLCLTIPELVHEWNFEIDWQSTWDSPAQQMTKATTGKSPPSSSSRC